MVSFEEFKPVDGVPIYQQILTYIKRGAVAGTVTEGDELPSRRVLSALLGIPTRCRKPLACWRMRG